MQLPTAAYPIPELWADNELWADAWRWLNKRRPRTMDGPCYVAEADVNAYAVRHQMDAIELAIAVDRIDDAYFAHLAAIKPKR